MSQIAYSQSDFREGFLITNEGDTINGLIDFRVSDSNFKKCTFKSSTNQETIYLPNEIKGYRFVNDRYYVSQEIKIDKNEYERVFLEVLVKGKISLYKYATNFYAKKDDSVFYELSNTISEQIINGKKYLKEDFRYRGVLAILFADCSSSISNLQNLKFNEKSLLKAVKNYNKCTNSESITFNEEKPWFRLEIGAALGLNLSTLNIEKTISPSNYDQSLSFFPSLLLNFSSPRVNERISIQTNISYLSTTYYSSSVIGTGIITRSDVIVDIKQLKIPIGFQYEFAAKKLIPYFNIGLSSTIHLNASANWVKEIEYNKIIRSSERPAFEVKPSQFGYWGGVGVKKTIYGKVQGFIEFRYEVTDGIENDRYIVSGIRNLSLFIGVKY